MKLDSKATSAFNEVAPACLCAGNCGLTCAKACTGCLGSCSGNCSGGVIFYQ